MTGALTTTSHDGATALAVMSELDKWWATSDIGTLRRAPGQPGVKARVYADIRRSGTQATQRTDDGPDVVQVGLGHGARWNLDLNTVRSIEALPYPGSLPAFLQVKGGFHPLQRLVCAVSTPWCYSRLSTPGPGVAGRAARPYPPLRQTSYGGHGAAGRLHGRTPYKPAAPLDGVISPPLHGRRLNAGGFVPNCPALGENSGGFMSRAVAELQQIPFSQLIGAPLKAAVEAQALAAQSTIEFIHKVGFQQEAQPDDLVFGDVTKDASAGKVRSVTFSYTKKDENDARKEFSLTVPFLAITPIPFIRIDEVTIDFNAKLTDSIERKTSSEFNLDSEVKGSYAAFWSPIKIEARVSATYNQKSSGSERQQREYTLQIHVRAVQDEMPAGLSRMLDILEQAIQEQPTSATS
ncbi:DUF6207 family protein [Streptomyces sp. NPDC005283]|uniref:DUF6207 family protein n=1 Tax=Streptomyces sp. NPDC005283 TaxID=3156871 RepID=UPI003455D84B